MALPSHFHTDAAISQLAAGKHVVVEKPMATSLADADRMVAAAAEADTVLSIFQNRRYNPDFVKVRNCLIDAGIFGRIVQVRITESRWSPLGLADPAQVRRRHRSTTPALTSWTRRSNSSAPPNPTSSAIWIAPSPWATPTITSRWCSRATAHPPSTSR
ncbi:MAG: Gfo/Idh/MocA family oxidoreductase [Caldilineaceae bacterium]